MSGGNSLGPSIMEAEDSQSIAALEFEEGGASGGLGLLVTLLERQHHAVMDYLTQQDEMLRQIHLRVDRDGSIVANLPDFQQSHGLAKMNSNLGTGSAGSNGSGMMSVFGGRSNAKDSAKLQSPGGESVAASIFTSYSQDDLMLRMEASAAATSPTAKENASSSKDVLTDTRIQRITRHVAFDIFFGAVVVSNAIFIGIDVGSHVGDTEKTDPSFKVIQYCYTAAFSVELVFRLLAAWQSGGLCRRGDDCMWNAFDGTIVTLAWLEVAMDIAQAVSNMKVDRIAGVSSLRAFRIIRLTRILKTAQVIRVLRFVMALRTLVTSILSTLKALFWALLLLFLIIYIFGLLFTQAVDEFIFKEDQLHQLSEAEAEASDRYFGTLFHSMLTLFMSIAGGVSWEDAVEPLMAISTVWVLCYLFYVSFTYFAVLNVVTAVFCQSAIESAQQDHATLMQSMLENKEAHLAKMRAVFSEIREHSDDGDECITFAMLEEKINSPTVQQLLETLGLDVWDAWSFFKLLDTDGGGSIELEEFFLGCLRLGGNARGLELGKVLQDQQWLIKTQGKFQNFVELELQNLSEAVNFLLRATPGHNALPLPDPPREAQVKDL